ncbi:unnamed protein product [Cyprideis torosa]|uniref:Uncharacterized protein n=1 Tax=Cyprideis torosa TaxID=163714 RepID=A0A7R8WPZ4_9CRUS|nr:unnamed protein product [Cyprideis torosa]CAG0902407.1 unnamed protein product [Cyprideis torosa]
MMFLLVFLATVCLAHALRLYLFKWRKMPPGPWGLPVLGYLPFLSRSKSHESYFELSKKYGPIFSLSLTQGVDAIVVTDADLINEMFSSDTFLPRPHNKMFQFFGDGGEHGFASATGKVWYDNRRFALRTLKDFGFGKTSLQDIIKVDVRQLTQRIRDRLNEPLTLGDELHVAIVNTIWHMIAEKSYNHEDRKLLDFFHFLHKSQKAFQKLGLLFFQSWLLDYLPDNWTAWADVMEFKKHWWIIRDEIKLHRESLMPDFNRDYIDCFLRNQQKEPNNESWGDIELFSNCRNLFIAGSETTAITINWFLLHMAQHPEVQRRCQREIDEVVGDSGREINMEDKGQLNFLEATIMEVMRAWESLHGWANGPPNIPRLPSPSFVEPRGEWTAAGATGDELPPATIQHHAALMDSHRLLQSRSHSRRSPVAGYPGFGGLAPIAPLNLSHSCRQDTYVKGYLIPKNSWICGDIHACHMDPKNFPNPDRFDPTRFLDSEGRLLKKSPKGWMPFSVGKRQCLGESLARMNLFLYTSALLQQFSFHEDPLQRLPFPVHRSGIFVFLQLQPPAVKILVKDRTTA